MQEETRRTLISNRNSCHLQPEMYCQAAQAYRRAGYGVGEPLHDAEIHSSVLNLPSCDLQTVHSH